MKKIIFINRYYAPDLSATAQLLTDLAEFIAHNNDNIHIVTSRQLYENPSSKLISEEVLNRVCIHRVYSSRFGRHNIIGRIVDYITFYISSFIFLLKFVKKDDVLVAKTDPPLISSLCALVVKYKKATLVNWMQDVFPEIALKLSVKGLSDGLFYRLLRSIRNWSLNKANKNVVLSSQMETYVNTQTNQYSKSIVIPNWVVGEDVRSISKKDNDLINQWGLSGKFVIEYSGNLGKAHDYKTILNTAKQFNDQEDIIFLLVGGGSGYTLLKKETELLGLKNLIFKPYQPIDNLSSSLSLADVHLISLIPELEGLIFPSKFYGVLAIGKPIVFIGDVNGEISTTIRDDNIGVSVEIGNSKELTDSILMLKNQKDLCLKMSSNARSVYEEKYSIDFSRQKWLELLNSI